MLTTRCTFVGLLLALLVGSPLQATVFFTYDITPLAGGAIAYDLNFNDDSATVGNWFAQNWTFTGDIQQTLAFGITAVTKEVDANSFDALQFAGSSYKKLEDTWVGAAFTAFPSDTSQIPPPPNPLEQPGFFSVTAGSDAANKLSKVLFVHLVAEGPISYSGSIARTGVDGPGPVHGCLGRARALVDCARRLGRSGRHPDRYGPAKVGASSVARRPTRRVRRTDVGLNR